MKKLAENTQLVTTNINNLEQHLDLEWYLLIMQAKSLGLSKTEVREFLQKQRFTNLENR
ncbi:anti-repressor SinI family protein [Bacillus sp. 03113]|uniref:anti-repressor SinI family protein n=1 Tax=Bacillus sp. 03113 TaxID=2578211 RepID=UPI0011422A11|nr:anti-repressor SinI family protein [Bacillus sp. 03113]